MDKKKVEPIGFVSLGKATILGEGKLKYMVSQNRCKPINMIMIHY